MNAWKRVIRFIGAVVGFAVRRRRLSVAVVIVALLLVVPLALTGDGEVFVLNAVGLGIAALLVQAAYAVRRRTAWRSVDGSDGTEAKNLERREDYDDGNGSGE